MAKENRNIIGSTGTNTLPLSDEAIQYRVLQNRIVRYQYTRLGPRNWCCWVCGPFHSRTYGVSGFGTKKHRAKAALESILANAHGYFGNMVYSDVDEADTVGDRYYGHNNGKIANSPITTPAW